jgi:hypothetical protein
VLVGSSCFAGRSFIARIRRISSRPQISLALIPIITLVVRMPVFAER